MAISRPASTSPSRQDSGESSINSSSPSARETKPGRPNHWTPSRQRKLARLYLCSILSPNDIRQALEEKTKNWMPGKESTTKTVNALLDKDPRWLRPKNRQEMDQRISGLSDCTTKRKLLWRFSPTSETSTVDVDQLPQTLEKEPITTPDYIGFIEDIEINSVEEASIISSTQFSETPLQDLLALAPQEPTGLVLDPSSPSFQYSQHTFRDSGCSNSLQEQSVTDSTPQPLRSHRPFTRWSRTTEVTMTDERSLSTEFSTTSLKRRLSHYPASILQDIARLLEAYSISDCSTAPASQATSSLLSGSDHATTSYATVRPSSGRASIALPSAFLFLDRYIRLQGLCLPGLKPHDSRTCWCLEDLDPESQLWVNRKGLVNQRIKDPPQSLKHLDLRFRDIFGNTLLHMLAARGAHISIIIRALEQGADPNAKNSAGQNFAHLLSRRLLRKLATDKIFMIPVLPKLATFNFRFNDCDHFGRNFFHTITRAASDMDPNTLQGLGWLESWNGLARDAFGWIAAVDRTTQATKTAPSQRTYSLAQLAKYPNLGRESNIDAGPSSSPQAYPDSSNAPKSADPSHFIFKHARLLETAGLAIDVPDIEDAHGRNGLQCLAEASLTLSDENGFSASCKRKRGQTDLDHSSTRLAFRYELARTLIGVGVDVNNYDKEGNTVLMAFVSHLPDGEDDKTLTQLLHYIIKSGANVHWRNRQGETALHIAVRLGRKVSTRVLLMNGSNVHARKAEGKGVLAVGEAHYLRARQKPQLYASILACMALCIQYGAVAQPTAVQEWSMRDGKPA